MVYGSIKNACLAAIVFATVVPMPVYAVTPESPEVRKLIDAGMKFLATAEDERLGGICLIGLSFVKDDQPDHPKVKEALKACQAWTKRPQDLDVYSNGIALIFLCELDARRHSDLINYYLGAMKRRQKQHGGWGYDARRTGDTSQTQYGTLGSWEAYRNGFAVEADSMARCINWLLATQDPSGTWGYQGKVGKDGKRTKQGETGVSMGAAGMSSLLVCADLFGLLKAGGAEQSYADEPLPNALKTPGGEKGSRPDLKSASIDRAKIIAAVQDGNRWFDKNFTTSIPRWKYYYLYALERYKSFADLLEIDVPEEPEWYEAGYEEMAKSQNDDGSWGLDNGGEATKATDTSFAVLFLMRSTQKSIRQSLGIGTMVSGRGAPANVTSAKMVRGQVVVEAAKTNVANMLAMLDDAKSNQIEQLANDPTALVAAKVDEKTAVRLEQIVRGGSPEARLLAVRALGQTGNLDYAPTLIFALTDPDRRVVREARDNLCFISRRFEGFGLPDRFTDAQRYSAIEKWKRWYLAVRPDALLDVK